MLICLAVFAWSSWQLILIWQQSNQVKEEAKELETITFTPAQEDENESEGAFLNPNWEALKAKNPDIIAWIYIPQCDISFPVVQGSDNAYYLNVTALGQYNPRGAIFADYQASSDFSDDNTVIYGHSVEGGGMFTSLDEYENADFFAAHPYYYLLTPEQNYKVNIYTFAKTQEQSVYYTTGFGSYSEEVLEQMKSEALYSTDTVVAGPLVSLSTCDLDYGFDSIQRLVLTGWLEPMEGKVYME
jgi:sortase B